MAVNMARKVWFEVCRVLLRTVFNPERHPPLIWVKAYLCVSEIQALFSLYFWYVYALLSPVNGLLTWSRKDKQICIQTHTLFRKAISRNPAHAHSRLCAHAWFKNLEILQTAHMSALPFHGTSLGKIYDIDHSTSIHRSSHGLKYSDNNIKA